jgi:hypothetical protein
VASLITAELDNGLGYLSEQGTASGIFDLATPNSELRACVAFKQSTSQAEIDQLFDVEKRGLS